MEGKQPFSSKANAKSGQSDTGRSVSVLRVGSKDQMRVVPLISGNPVVLGAGLKVPVRKDSQVTAHLSGAGHHEADSEQHPYLE
jgi:hypothetical protein